MANTENEATVWDDEAEIQPEGGLNEDDIFDSAEFANDALEKLFADESDADEEDENKEEETDGAEESTPTTENDSEAAENDKQEEQSPTTENETGLPKKLTFTAKIDRKEQSIEVDESELPEIYQKAHNYTRLSDKYNKLRDENRSFRELAVQLGYESVDALIKQAAESDRKTRVDALVSSGTSQEIAEDFIDRKIRSAKENVKFSDDEEEESDTESDNKTDEKNKALDDAEYFRAQVADFFAARPDLKGKLKTLPKEVSEAVVLRKGSLREIYAEWEMRQQKADTEKIRKEKELFAQQVEAATRAPVRGTPDAHTGKGEKPDSLRDAFRADMNW